MYGINLMIGHIKLEGNIGIMNDHIRCWFQKGHFQGHLRSNKVIIVNRTHFKHSFRIFRHIMSGVKLKLL